MLPPYYRLPLALLILTAGAIIWLLWPQAAPPIKASDTAPRVEVIAIQPGRHAVRIRTQGQATHAKQATLRATQAADVSHTFFYPGDSVEQGQELVRLQSTKLQYKLEQQQAKMKELAQQIAQEKLQHRQQALQLQQHHQLRDLQQKEVNRQRFLTHHDVAATKHWEQAQQQYVQTQLALLDLQHEFNQHPLRLNQLVAKLEQAHAVHAQLQHDQKRLQVIAPFTGHITKLHVHHGDRVAAQTDLISLYAPNQVEMTVALPANLTFTTQETAASITATASHRQQHWPLQFDRLHQHIDQQHASQQAIFTPANDAPPLAPGQWFTVDLVTQNNHSFIIPRTALFYNETVYRVTPTSTLEAIEVQLLGPSQQDDHAVVIRSQQLHDQDQLLATPLPNAQTGLRVRVTTEDSP